MTDNTTEVDLLTLGEKSTAFFFTFTHYIPSAGLQITVDHWTLAAQNLLMSNESLTAVRHNHGLTTNLSYHGQAGANNGWLAHVKNEVWIFYSVNPESKR